MVNRDSPSYQAGRILGRCILIGLGYMIGKRWGRKPIDKSFPEKKTIVGSVRLDQSCSTLHTAPVLAPDVVESTGHLPKRRGLRRLHQLGKDVLSPDGHKLQLDQ